VSALRPDLTLDLVTARRLAVEAQGLAGPRPPASRDGIMQVFDRIGRVQLDPTSAVAPSHQLVLWSRLGPYELDDLEALRWDDRRLIEYRAFLYQSADFPLLAAQMRSFPRGQGASRAKLITSWMNDNAVLREHILDELDRDGPLPTDAFQDLAVASWQSSGWTNARNVTRMLELLAESGAIAVAARERGQRLWDLVDRCLPADVPREPLGDDEAARERAERAVRSHGVLSRREIEARTWTDRPLDSLVPDLEAEGRLVGVTLLDRDGQPMPGPHFVHRYALSLLDGLRAPGWHGRTTLLSPFDVLTKDRERTLQLFGFRYRLEMYVPVADREFGYYVLPILHGDRLIGRVDPFTDRKAGILRIKGIWAEPDAPHDRATVDAVAGTIGELATFLGASDVTFETPPPRPWRALRG
jgi:uncharacterized protein YcaQ